jgi:hypothetical protein
VIVKTGQKSGRINNLKRGLNTKMEFSVFGMEVPPSRRRGKFTIYNKQT